jgi:hypothetical protein
MRHILFIVLITACAEGSSSTDELVPSGPVQAGKGDNFCPGVPARIAPTTPPPYSCGRLDPVNAAIAADVNRFWGSSVVACACGPDFPEGCEGAWSLFDTGYIYLGVPFLDGLGTSGSRMPAQYVVAHEFAHEIQGHYNAFAPTTQQRELTADCLAGYYLGSHVCRGTVTERDLITTLATACIIGDGTGDPIADLETHGTCEQRVESVKAGIRAYFAGEAPLEACAL